MKTKLLFIFFIVLIVFSCKSGKEFSEKKFYIESYGDRYRIMFYNVENLFDPENDPNKNDDEFTPEGARFWTEYRKNEKLKNIYKVITAVGEWDLPMIVGLSEIENRRVLEQLISYTPLHKADYNIIHYESPDFRGIDVALLYRKSLFTPINHNIIRVIWPAHLGTGTTRDVLYVWGRTINGDTLHFYVNHWPSRYAGQMETEEKRIYVAGLVKKHTDSVLSVHPNAKIIIIGDLNDHPTDKSVAEGLKAQLQFDKIVPDKLYNLTYYVEKYKGKGSHKHDGMWGILDQIVVSGTLLDTTQSIYTRTEYADVFDADFLLEPDEKFTGKKVFRTYIGFKYHGGFSDHLPVFLDLKRKLSD
ncbi:MAG: endonuclease/exonuclease/phosphatase family protein [Bacteroidales bacterium]|nr:endonuclease [Bacteroidales bacterium]HOL98110.1 endonuclease [Bacteroidales bacterium]HOM36219.1 endonuclease [Bacteroidales bacterium]HPD23750.1 endonuclease [Bacteroidales bacterium]HRS99772.1 endonuclease [Bacteroidales bacterium]